MKTEPDPQDKQFEEFIVHDVQHWRDADNRPVCLLVLRGGLTIPLPAWTHQHVSMDDRITVYGAKPWEPRGLVVNGEVLFYMNPREDAAMRFWPPQGNPMPRTLSVPVLAIGHLTDEEAHADPEEWPCACWENAKVGFFVYVADHTEWSQDLNSDEWPGLVACARWAEQHGYEWIRFDQDEVFTIPGMPTYHW
jgi:hypothetical protein